VSKVSSTGQHARRMGSLRCAERGDFLVGRGRGWLRAVVGAAILLAAPVGVLLLMNPPKAFTLGRISDVDLSKTPHSSPTSRGPSSGANLQAPADSTLTVTAPQGSRGSVGGARGPMLGAARSTSVLISGQPVECVDVRTGLPFPFQAQHLLSSGLIEEGWSPDSTEFCLGSADGTRDLVESDGSGGSYVAWVDSRLGAPDIYLARVTSSGATASGWPEGGMPVCTAPLSQYNVDACSDGAGGVLLAWQDFRSGHNSRVYVARIGPSGAAASGWSEGGVPVATGSPDQYSPRIATDGSGGAFVIWQSREPNGLGARMQHLTSSGAAASGWPAAGAALITGTAQVAGLSLSLENNGQLQVVWSAAQDSSRVTLKSAWLDPSSVPDSAWATVAITLSSGAKEISEPRLARCANGSLMVAWSEWRGGLGSIKAQELDASGSRASGWPADAVTLADSVAIAEPAILPATQGGGILAWEDRRNGSSSDIYAAKLDADGTRDGNWPSGGVPVCTAAGMQYAPAIAADGNGGAIVVWSDESIEAAGSYLAARQSKLDPARLIRVETNSGYARITWEVEPGSGDAFPAYRATSAGEWNLLSVLAPNDSSHVVLEDKAAPLGEQVQYRLAIQSQGVIRFLTPVAVNVPADPLRLELSRAWPSVHRDGIEIVFALPRGPVARVDVFDVMGRRVGELALNQFTPGIHSARVLMNTPAPSSIYFVRLTQGSRSSTRRVVFLR
jgi:hypothetical protein